MADGNLRTAGVKDVKQIAAFVALFIAPPAVIVVVPLPYRQTVGE
jgi:hypothetical protein